MHVEADGDRVMSAQETVQSWHTDSASDSEEEAEDQWAQQSVECHKRTEGPGEEKGHQKGDPVGGTRKGEATKVQLNISVEMTKEAHEQYPTTSLLKQYLEDKALPVQRLDMIKVLEQAPFHEMNADESVCRVPYRAWAGGVRLAPVLQVIIPEELGSRAAAAHDEGKNSHPSAIRSFQAVSQKFDWPGMLACIRRCQKQCPVCQYDKKLRNTHAIAGHIVALRPGSVWVVDLMKMPKVEDGSKWVLVCVDAFSRYVEVAALK